VKKAPGFYHISSVGDLFNDTFLIEKNKIGDKLKNSYVLSTLEIPNDDESSLFIS